ncbi:ribonuclease H-like domain-containing protein, partial [Tanacetum coccineum]
SNGKTQVGTRERRGKTTNGGSKRVDIHHINTRTIKFTFVEIYLETRSKIEASEDPRQVLSIKQGPLTYNECIIRELENEFDYVGHNPLVDHGREILERLTRANMRNAMKMMAARHELHRSMTEKEEFIRNYREMFDLLNFEIFRVLWILVIGCGLLLINLLALLTKRIKRIDSLDPAPVTRISKLDISDPLHLHPNDTTALTIVSIKLKGTENYQVWSYAMLLALEGKNKTGFIDGTCKRSNTDDILGKQWDRYHKLNALWKQYDAMIEFPNSILSREVLPDVRSAYATISREESHRVAADSIPGSSQRNQASTFDYTLPYRQNIQRNNQNNSTRPSRPNNLSNNRKGGGLTVVYENYGFNGHTIDRCFKIIGYPADFGKKKSGQNFKTQKISNNNSARKSSSSGFTDEQMATVGDSTCCCGLPLAADVAFDAACDARLVLCSLMFY